MRVHWTFAVGALTWIGCEAPAVTLRTDAGATGDAAAAGDLGDAQDAPRDAPDVGAAAGDAPDVPASDAPDDAPSTLLPGSLGAPCRRFSVCAPDYPGAACEGGLACEADLCVQGLFDGARCERGVGAPCAEHSECVVTGAEGRCVRDGYLGGRCIYTARRSCDLGGTSDFACTEGLYCTTDLHCETIPTPTTPCTGLLCGDGFACVRQGSGRVCLAFGSVGAPCAVATIARCVAGAACVRSGDDMDYPERCVPALARGAVCDPNVPTPPCVEGESCGPGPDGPRCLPNGSAGTPCVGSGSCNAGVTCAEDRCARAAEPGASCEPRFNSVLCPGDTACLPSDLGLTRGACTVGVLEHEPNDEAAPEPLSASAVIVGEVGVAGDAEDCFRVVAPAGSTLIAETADRSNVGCFPGLTTITVTSASPVFSQRSTSSRERLTCARVVAPSLAAGTYRVCVRPSASGTAVYRLSLALLVGP